MDKTSHLPVRDQVSAYWAFFQEIPDRRHIGEHGTGSILPAAANESDQFIALQEWGDNEQFIIGLKKEGSLIGAGDQEGIVLTGTVRQRGEAYLLKSG